MPTSRSQTNNSTTTSTASIIGSLESLNANARLHQRTMEAVERRRRAETVRANPEVSSGVDPFVIPAMQMPNYYSDSRRPRIQDSEAYKYYYNLSLEDAQKNHPWITEEESNKPNIVLNQGVKYNDNSVLVYLGERLSIDVPLEEFKSKLRLAYVKFYRFSGSSLDGEVLNVQPEQFLYNGDNEYKRVGFIEDGCVFVKSPSNETLVLFNKNNLPKRIKTYYNFCTDDDEPETMIAELEIAYSGQENLILREIHSAMNVCRSMLSRKMHEYELLNTFRTRRVNVNSKKHIGKKKGLYITHDIPFSCEIECYGKNKKTVALVSNAAGTEIGFSHDGSLTSGIGYPVEIQTPILLGKRGEICIANLCNMLVEHGFMVDKTCGLHIHLDGSRFRLRDADIVHGLARPTNLISLYLFYRLFDPAIVSFLPSTRRNNRYCAEMDKASSYHDIVVDQDSTEMAFKVMKNINTLRDFELYWYRVTNYDNVMREKQNRYTPTRYYGANFHSLLKDNHFEIRYHSGTKNYEKIMYWINLHGKILEKCIDGSINEEMLNSIRKQNLSIPELIQLMYQILDLNEDEREYLNGRYEAFKGSAPTEEILIAKTKGQEIY